MLTNAKQLLTTDSTAISEPSRSYKNATEIKKLIENKERENDTLEFKAFIKQEKPIKGKDVYFITIDDLISEIHSFMNGDKVEGWIIIGVRESVAAGAGDDKGGGCAGSLTPITFDATVHVRLAAQNNPIEVADFDKFKEIILTRLIKMSVSNDSDDSDDYLKSLVEFYEIEVDGGYVVSICVKKSTTILFKFSGTEKCYYRDGHQAKPADHMTLLRLASERQAAKTDKAAQEAIMRNPIISPVNITCRDEHLNSIFDMIKESDAVAEIRKIIATYPYLLDMTDVEGHTIMHMAAFYGRIEILKYCVGVDKGFKYKTNFHGVLPIVYAMSSHRYDELKDIFNEKEDDLILMNRDREGNTVYHWAAFIDAPILKYLLSKLTIEDIRTTFSITNIFGYTLLANAALVANLESLVYILTHPIFQQDVMMNIKILNMAIRAARHLVVIEEKMNEENKKLMNEENKKQAISILEEYKNLILSKDEIGLATYNSGLKEWLSTDSASTTDTGESPTATSTAGIFTAAGAGTPPTVILEESVHRTVLPR